MRERVKHHHPINRRYRASSISKGFSILSIIFAQPNLSFSVLPCVSSQTPTSRRVDDTPENKVDSPSLSVYLYLSLSEAPRRINAVSLPLNCSFSHIKPPSPVARRSSSWQSVEQLPRWMFTATIRTSVLSPEPEMIQLSAVCLYNNFRLYTISPTLAFLPKGLK